MDGEQYRNIFPETYLQSGGNIGQQYLRNREIIEYVGHDGYFRNTTVEGSITGEGLDLGVIDDPIKGRKDANSLTKRDSTWDWFTDDFFTRFSDNAGLLCILTRWHIDDPIGRMLEKFPEAKVLKFRAIATHDEKYRKCGEELFPEHKSLSFLLERKQAMDSASWEALYQQSPIVQGGGVIKVKHFKYYTVLPLLKYRLIFGDTAQKTEEVHDYSVLQCWGLSHDGYLYLVDQIRGKWEAPELLRRTHAFWEKHKQTDVVRYGVLRAIYIEDKVSGTGLIQEAKHKYRLPIFGIQRDKDKYTRVCDIIGYLEAGYIFLDENADYLSDFLSECESFTADDKHQKDDQIDPFVDAVKEMLAKFEPYWSRIGREKKI
jgi:predicted phage terminase large subunit-like protein